MSDTPVDGHEDGFFNTSGHGTIALGVWAVQSGRIAPPATGVTDVVLDVPSGEHVFHVDPLLPGFVFQ